jgi:protein-S-isoprenylcysteine O-methyltransferase Ste14
VGVKEGETGALVQGGLFRLSRNPTFLGQLVLLAGVAMAIPSLPTLAGAVLFFWSASVQIRSEEAALSAANGASYDAFRRSVPRWIGWPGKAYR